jgi:hypothetical protein
MNDYFLSAKLSLDYRNGLIKRPVVIHSNPVDYGLTELDVIKIKLSLINKKIKPIKERIERLSTSLPFEKSKDSISFGLSILEDDQNELEKLNKQKKIYIGIKNDLMNNDRNSLENLYKNKFDIERLKQIPLDNFVEINRQGKFKVRDEKTPSCHWYRDSNTWVDFGGDNRKMDVIDLVQKLHKIDFISACKLLNNY